MLVPLYAIVLINRFGHPALAAERRFLGSNAGAHAIFVLTRLATSVPVPRMRISSGHIGVLAADAVDGPRHLCPIQLLVLDHQLLVLRASKPGGVFSPQWDRIGHFLCELLLWVRMGLGRRHVICLPCVGYLTKVTDNSWLAGYLVVWEGPASRGRKSTLLCLRTSTKAVRS